MLVRAHTIFSAFVCSTTTVTKRRSIAGWSGGIKKSSTGMATAPVTDGDALLPPPLLLPVLPPSLPSQHAVAQGASPPHGKIFFAPPVCAHVKTLPIFAIGGVAQAVAQTQTQRSSSAQRRAFAKACMLFSLVVRAFAVCDSAGVCVCVCVSCE
jgi:hypothetical protein